MDADLIESDFKGEHVSLNMYRGWQPGDPPLPHTGTKIHDAQIAAGSTTLTSASGPFTSDMVGWLIVVRAAGVNGADLGSTIASFIDANTIHLADAASTTISLAVTPTAICVFGLDMTTALQTVASSVSYFLIPEGIYLINGKITISPFSHISGRSKHVEIWNVDSTDYTFEFISEIRPAAYDINSSLMFENFTLYAKFGVKLNAETPPASPNFQGSILHCGVHNVEFQGQYASAGDGAYSPVNTDPNNSTNIEPTWDEMLAYGVGINVSQCFGLTIDDYSLVQHFGIGVYLNNSDESVINGNRITQNGHNIGLRGIITQGMGNKNKLLNNALGANKRVGCVRLEGTTGSIIRNNYFETYSDACRFVWSKNNIGPQWIGNHIENPDYPPFAGHTVTTPICLFDDWHSVLIAHNVMDPNGNPVPPMSFGYTYWDGFFNVNQYNVLDNGLHWPTPDSLHPADVTLSPMIGGVMTKPWNAYRFAADNIPYRFIAGSTTFPFELNATTGRWATIKRAAVSELAVKFPLQSQLYRKYIFRFTLLNAVGGATGGVGGVQIFYEGAATTLIGSFAFNPTSTTAVAIREVAVTIPVGEITNGLFNVHIDTQTVNWEEILVLPVDESNGFTLNYGDTASYDPITSMAATATSSLNQPNNPIIDIVDVDRPFGAERGTLRIRVLGALTKMFYWGISSAISATGAAFLQALNSGVGALPLALNPSGGRLLLRQSTDDGANDIQSTGFAKHTGDFHATGQVTVDGNLQVNTGTANKPAKFDGAKDLVGAAIDLTADVTGNLQLASLPTAGVTGSPVLVISLNITQGTINYASGANSFTAVTAITNNTVTLGFQNGLRTS